jgi:hypothetical protein
MVDIMDEILVVSGSVTFVESVGGVGKCMVEVYRLGMVDVITLWKNVVIG